LSRREGGAGVELPFKRKGLREGKGRGKGESGYVDSMKSGEMRERKGVRGNEVRQAKKKHCEASPGILSTVLRYFSECKCILMRVLKWYISYRGCVENRNERGLGGSHIISLPLVR